MKISELKKNSEFNGWKIISEVNKIRRNKQTKYFATVRCPFCGNEYEANLSPIFYGNSRKCKECHKPKKYDNIYVEKELIVEIHFINRKTGECDYISKINKKYLNNVKKYSWGISKGYVVNTRLGRVESSKSRLHRLVYSLEYGVYSFEKNVVDHINRNTLDNRIENLNLVAAYENNQNTRTFKNNKSGTKGVSWDNYSKGWSVSIQLQGKRYYLGVYKDKSEAIRVRKEAEEKYHRYYFSLIQGGDDKNDIN